MIDFSSREVDYINRRHIKRYNTKICFSCKHHKTTFLTLSTTTRLSRDSSLNGSSTRTSMTWINSRAASEIAFCLTLMKIPPRSSSETSSQSILRLAFYSQMMSSRRHSQAHLLTKTSLRRARLSSISPPHTLTSLRRRRHSTNLARAT